MALRHQPAPTARSNSLTVTPGQWIRVAVPGDPWPVQIQIARLDPVPAFIDRDRGNPQTYAQIRCPSLAAGTYPVRVLMPDGVVEASVQVL